MFRLMAMSSPTPPQLKPLLMLSLLLAWLLLVHSLLLLDSMVFLLELLLDSMVFLLVLFLLELNSSPRELPSVKLMPKLMLMQMLMQMLSSLDLMHSQ